MERTLILIKPDGVKRNLIGEIIRRYEKAGLKVMAMKMLKIDRRFAEKHYWKNKDFILGMGNKTLNASKGNLKEVKRIFGSTNPWRIGLILRKWMINFLISYTIVGIILESKNAVKKAREISGFTDPSRAKKGTIRGDLGTDSILNANRQRRATENLVHASGNNKEAEREIRLLFHKLK